MFRLMKQTYYRVDTSCFCNFPDAITVWATPLLLMQVAAAINGAQLVSHTPSQGPKGTGLVGPFSPVLGADVGAVVVVSWAFLFRLDVSFLLRLF